MCAARRNNPVLLVIEDDAGLQSQLKWCFEGYEVQVAGDADAAISLGDGFVTATRLAWPKIAGLVAINPTA